MPEKGAKVPQEEHCTICQKIWPRADHFIGVLGLTKVYLFEDQFFPGWTVLALQEHRTELFQLTQAERSGLMEEVSRVGDVLAHLFSARKVNYELLGNQVPHIHWHLIPRLKTDPDPLKPVWCVPHEPRRLEEEVLGIRLQTLRSALDMS